MCSYHKCICCAVGLQCEYSNVDLTVCSVSRCPAGVGQRPPGPQGKQGARGVRAEDSIALLGDMLAECVDMAECGGEVEAYCQGTHAGVLSEKWKEWIHGKFAANTRVGVQNKMHDWRLFLSALDCPGNAETVCWPPEEAAWLDFLHLARAAVSSYKRFRCVVGNVCEVGCAFAAQRTGKPPCQFDPRLRYAAVHRRALQNLKRQYGMGVRQVKGITMSEARNMFRFIDPSSIKDVSRMAAFSMGVTLGGRRSRTLTSIRIAHLAFTAEEVSLGDAQKRVLAPCVVITFHDEKVMDEAGPRMSGERCWGWHEADATWLQRGCSYWLYRLMVLRGMFTKKDPLLSAKKGDVLQLRPDARDFFVFCGCSDDYWVDAMAVRPGTISNYNRELLRRFGSDPRGFSSHRRGCVTRACTLDVMEHEGKQLSDGTLNAIARWGGWQAFTGVRTLLRVYAQTVLDSFLDGFRLGLGRQPGKEEWAARTKEYIGPDVFPEEAFVAPGSLRPLRVRFHVWHNGAVAAWREEMNMVVGGIVAKAVHDQSIWPVRRFVCERDAFVAFCKRYPDHALVMRLRTLEKDRAKVHADATALAEAQFNAEACSMLGRRRVVSRQAFWQHVAPVHVGPREIEFIGEAPPGVGSIADAFWLA